MTKGLLLILFVLFLIVFFFFFKIYKVETRSMANTILPGDKIVAFTNVNKDKIPTNTTVAFEYNFEKLTVFIKRIVAIEGDTIFANQKGLRINDKTYPFDSVTFLLTKTDSISQSTDYSIYFKYLADKTNNEQDF